MHKRPLLLRAATLGALLLLGAYADSASAQTTDPAAAARTLESDANRLRDTGRFKAALELYERAYSLNARPGTVFNMAQCHRELGDAAQGSARLEHFRKAVYLYGKFIALQPDDPDRPVVEKTMATLETRMREVILPAGDASAPRTNSANDGDNPAWYRRWYVWAGVGAVVVGGVVAVVVASRSSSPAGAIPNSFGTISAFGAK